MKQFEIGRFTLEIMGECTPKVIDRLMDMLQWMSDSILNIRYDKEIEILNAFFCLLFKKPVGFSVEINRIDGVPHWVQRWCVYDASTESIVVSFHTTDRIKPSLGQQFSERLFHAFIENDYVIRESEKRSEHAYRLSQQYIYKVSGKYVFQEKEIVVDKTTNRPKLTDWSYLTHADKEDLLYMLTVPTIPNWKIRLRGLFSFGRAQRFSRILKVSRR